MHGVRYKRERAGLLDVGSTPRAVEQAGRQASWQASSVSHTLGAVNSISTCLFPIVSGCVAVVRAH